MNENEHVFMLKLYKDDHKKIYKWVAFQDLRLYHKSLSLSSPLM